MIASIAPIGEYPFQLTAARRRLATPQAFFDELNKVSTHSRPKAAGFVSHFAVQVAACFNSQPPEGGWCQIGTCRIGTCSFNSQPPEGGWLGCRCVGDALGRFQLTAARRRLVIIQFDFCGNAPFQLTAARRRLGDHRALAAWRIEVSTHSRPKAAGKFVSIAQIIKSFQLTAARRRLASCCIDNAAHQTFQLTAARRRLGKRVSRLAIGRLFQLTAARRRLGCPIQSAC